MSERRGESLNIEEALESISAEELDEFLSRKGAIELLCELESGGSRFNELGQALDVSSTTLTKRLVEGQEASLIKVRPKREGQSTIHIYTFTLAGNAVRYYLINSSTIAAHQRLRDARENFEEKAEEAREWVVENSDRLTEDEIIMREFLGDIRTDLDNFDNKNEEAER